MNSYLYGIALFLSSAQWQREDLIPAPPPLSPEHLSKLGLLAVLREGGESAGLGYQDSFLEVAALVLGPWRVEPRPAQADLQL